MGKLHIVEGDITTFEGSAIVNAANKFLERGGGVCGAIFEAAGEEELTKECRLRGPLETSEVILTRGYNLKAKYILHAVGPIYDEEYKKECKKLLHNTYENIFKVCEEYGIKNIAIPSISTGIFAYPVEEASKIALEVIYDHLEEMDDIYVYCFENKTYNIYLENNKKYLDKIK